MAPEQAAGKPVDERSDIWSLGVVLQEMIFGSRQEPRGGEMSVPRAVIRVIRKARRSDPESRYRTAHEFVEALENLVAGGHPARFEFGKQTWFVFAAILATLAAVGVVIGVVNRYSPDRNTEFFRPDRISKLTTTGKSVDAVLSSDGRYMLYIQKDSDRYSIRLRDIATGADRERFPPVPTIYSGLTIAPGGTSFYYLSDDNRDLRTLYNAPLMEGAEHKVIEDVDSPVAISPNGQQLEFVRGNPRRGTTAILLSSAEGAAIRTIAERSFPRAFQFGGAAWLPDGKSLVVAAFDEAGRASLYEVQTASGQQKQIGDYSWDWIGRISLSPGGRTIVFVARNPSSNALQIYELSLKDRSLRAVTNDLSSYQTVSAGGSDLVSIEQNRLAGLWITDLKNPARSRWITPASGRYFEIASSPDGSWLTLTGSGRELNIWRIFSDGTQRRVTSGSHVDANPAVSTDGRKLAFASNRSGGWHLWTSDTNGQFLHQLTSGAGEDSGPSFAPDGAIAYSEQSSGSDKLMLIRPDGTGPVPLLQEARNPVVSPDGSLIACELKDSGAWQTAVIDLKSVQVIRRFPTIPPGSWVQWMADSRALAYIVAKDGAPNIATQPLSGMPGSFLTDFKEDVIFSFAISRDGQHIASVRGVPVSDVVGLEQLEGREKNGK
jgi:TolB protein